MSATLNGPGNPWKDAVDENEEKGMGQKEKGKQNKEEILRKLQTWVLLELSIICINILDHNEDLSAKWLTLWVCDQ